MSNNRPLTVANTTPFPSSCLWAFSWWDFQWLSGLSVWNDVQRQARPPVWANNRVLFWGTITSVGSLGWNGANTPMPHTDGSCFTPTGRETDCRKLGTNPILHFHLFNQSLHCLSHKSISLLRGVRHSRGHPAAYWDERHGWHIDFWTPTYRSAIIG